MCVNVCYRCDLNNASHLDHPSDFVDNENAEYHVREAFSIDPVCVCEVDLLNKILLPDLCVRQLSV